jgi:zinc transport system substrate-binding protein
MNTIIKSFAFFVCASLAYGQITVVSTIPALGLLVKQIGGEHVIVKNLFDQPTDPHFFQLTPKQLTLLHQAELTISAQEFADKIPLPAGKIISIYNKNQQSKIYLNAIKHFSKVEQQHHEHHEHHACHHHHHATSMIKHEWISFYGAIALSELIVEKLSSLDPDHQSYFEQNSHLLCQEIKQLKNLYRYKSLKSKHVFYHDNFNNLANELHRNLGPSLYHCEESNVSSRDLASIIEEQETYGNLLIDSTTNSHSLARLTDKIKLPVISVDTLGYGHYTSYTAFIEKILKIIYQEPQVYEETLIN